MKLYDENGNAVLIGNFIENNFPNILEDIIENLNKKASSYNQFSLPIYEADEQMKLTIVDTLNKI